MIVPLGPLKNPVQRARPVSGILMVMPASAVNLDDVTAAIRNLDPAKFTSLHILDRVPAIFESREQYASWRDEIGRGLDVDPLCLAVVGSTAVGVSLSPDAQKQLKPFHDSSDVDLAVVSSRFFDEAWRWLRSLGPIDKLKTNSPDAADLLNWHRRSLVFDGTIATERLLSFLPFGAEWTAVLGRAALLRPTQDRNVNARIYRDFDSLREYHRANVERLKIELLTADLAEDSDTALAEKGA